MSLQYFDEKIYFYKDVFLFFYLNIVCKNIVCDVGLRKEKLVSFHLKMSHKQGHLLFSGNAYFKIAPFSK